METNDYGTVTTYSVAVDGPPFGDEETFNDPFAMPHSPDLAWKYWWNIENIEKQAVVLPVYPKHVRTWGWW